MQRTPFVLGMMMVIASCYFLLFYSPAVEEQPANPASERQSIDPGLSAADGFAVGAAVMNALAGDPPPRAPSPAAWMRLIEKYPHPETKLPLDEVERNLEKIQDFIDRDYRESVASTRHELARRGLEISPETRIEQVDISRPSSTMYKEVLADQLIVTYLWPDGRRAGVAVNSPTKIEGQFLVYRFQVTREVKEKEGTKKNSKPEVPPPPVRNPLSAAPVRGPVAEVGQALLKTLRGQDPVLPEDRELADIAFASAMKLQDKELRDRIIRETERAASRGQLREGIIQDAQQSRDRAIQALESTGFDLANAEVEEVKILPASQEIPDLGIFERGIVRLRSGDKAVVFTVTKPFKLDGRVIVSRFNLDAVWE